MLITEKLGKIKKNSVNFFKNLRQFFVKFNDPEAINWKNSKNKEKYKRFFQRFEAIFSQI